MNGFQIYIPIAYSMIVFIFLNIIFSGTQRQYQQVLENTKEALLSQFALKYEITTAVYWHSNVLHLQQ